jgi:hypothetical protein
VEKNDFFNAVKIVLLSMIVLFLFTINKTIQSNFGDNYILSNNTISNNKAVVDTTESNFKTINGIVEQISVMFTDTVEVQLIIRYDLNYKKNQNIEICKGRVKELLIQVFNKNIKDYNYTSLDFIHPDNFENFIIYNLNATNTLLFDLNNNKILNPVLVDPSQLIYDISIKLKDKGVLESPINLQLDMLTKLQTGNTK